MLGLVFRILDEVTRMAR